MVSSDTTHNPIGTNAEQTLSPTLSKPCPSLPYRVKNTPFFYFSLLKIYLFAFKYIHKSIPLKNSNIVKRNDRETLKLLAWKLKPSLNVTLSPNQPSLPILTSNFIHPYEGKMEVWSKLVSARVLSGSLSLFLRFVSVRTKERTNQKSCVFIGY